MLSLTFIIYTMNIVYGPPEVEVNKSLIVLKLTFERKFLQRGMTLMVIH